VGGKIKKLGIPGSVKASFTLQESDTATLTWEKRTAKGKEKRKAAHRGLQKGGEVFYNIGGTATIGRFTQGRGSVLSGNCSKPLNATWMKSGRSIKEGGGRPSRGIGPQRTLRTGIKGVNDRRDARRGRGKKIRGCSRRKKRLYQQRGRERKMVTAE